MRAIMNASRSGQQIQIEERCGACGFLGLHRLSQVCSNCGSCGPLTVASRAARASAAAARADSSDIEVLHQLSPGSFLPPPRPAFAPGQRSSPIARTPPRAAQSSREASPQGRLFGSPAMERLGIAFRSPRGISTPGPGSPQLASVDRRLFSPSSAKSPGVSPANAQVSTAVAVQRPPPTSHLGAFRPRPLSEMVDPFSISLGSALPSPTLPLQHEHEDQVRMRQASSRAVFQPTLAQPFIL